MNDSIDFIYNLIKEKGVLALSDCQGSCPCGHFYIRGITIEFSCWRSNDNHSLMEIKQHYDFNYNAADLQKLGESCLEDIRQVWFNCDWELLIHKKDE